jgi:hypothetical protein
MKQLKDHAPSTLLLQIIVRCVEEVVSLSMDVSAVLPKMILNHLLLGVLLGVLL